MRFFLLILLLSLLRPAIGWGQAPVTLDQWPARLQLYPRDKTSQCIVVISGRAPVNQIKAISLVVLRNQQFRQYSRTGLDPLTGQFSFKPVIKAERSEYSFQLFAHPITGDSVQIALRDSIVCGDVFLIMGQSNAVGRFIDKPYQSEFSRTFGVNQGGIDYNPADTAWCLTNTTEGNNALWSVELQRLINEQHGIPTAVINGAVGGTTITNHANRDTSQHANLSTLYGRLLYRAKKAGVANRIRAMIWRQGEAEAVNDPSVYIKVFPQLYSYWKQDYPTLGKVYHSQINILPDSIVRAGFLRDFQRRSKTIFGDNEPIATIGLPDYTGLHYNEAGYRQFGLELYRLVARDFYGSTDTSNISSPNLQRLYYSTVQQDEITMEFEPGQVMQWPADTTITNPKTGNHYTQTLSNFIYTDYPGGETGIIKSVTQQGNLLILKLTKPVTAKHLTYLPSSYKDSEIGYYVGPVIRNRRGMRALTFYQVPIAPFLPGPTELSATPVDTSAIKLTWSLNTPSDSVANWAIERADTNGLFRSLIQLPASARTYADPRIVNHSDSLKLDKTYAYRVRALSRQAESVYSPVALASLHAIPAAPASTTAPAVMLGPELALLAADSLDHSAALVYPNPASDQVRVRLPLDWSGNAINLSLTNEAGLVVLSRTERPSTGVSYFTFSVAALPIGIYVLTMRYQTGGVRCRLVVGH